MPLRRPAPPPESGRAPHPPPRAARRSLSGEKSWACSILTHRHRANEEDLAERGGNPALLVRGKTRDRIAYLRPDMARRLKEVLALRGTVGRGAGGAPLFSD